MKSNLKTSAEWNDLFRDYFTIEKEEAYGWNKRNFNYAWNKEKIHINEFLSRMKNSTCYWKKSWNEVSNVIEYVRESYNLR